MGQQPHHSRHNNNNNNNNHSKKPNVNSEKTAGTSTSAMVNQRGNDAVDGRSQTANGSTTSDVFYLAVYGWRKKCLFTLILLLMVLIIINLSLTLWILKVMEFSGVSATRSLGVNQATELTFVCFVRRRMEWDS
jgi:Sarcoglycan complex subunit protein